MQSMGFPVFLSLLAVAAGQGGSTTAWVDVCTSEEFISHKQELCPEVFQISTLAFNPLEPSTNAKVTIILQPTMDLPSTIEETQFLDVTLPSFEPVGAVVFNDPLQRELTVTASNPTPPGEDVATAYNTYLNPVLMPRARYSLTTQTLRITVALQQTMLASRYAEAIICCFILPTMSPMDNPAFRIAAPTSLSQNVNPAVLRIMEEPVKISPYLDPGFQWDFIMVQFHPPVAYQLTVIELTLRPADDLRDRFRVILSLPQITRVPAANADFSFTTENSEDPNDFMFFASLARWDQQLRTITYFLREGMVLPAYRQVSLSTLPGEFQLPIQVVPNWDQITVEAQSFDGVDEIIKPTKVKQSTHVPHVRYFTDSALTYQNNVPGALSDVDLSFRTNRPMFAGTVIYLRLSGFQAQVVEVPLGGDLKAHFMDEVALMSLPENLITLRVNVTLYSNEFVAVVKLLNLIMPPALYANDPSLLIWNSDPDCERQPIKTSPEVGGGNKVFVLSKIEFSPMEPRRASTVTFSIRPSIVFFQGDTIVFHLYGFFAVQDRLPLTGPQAYKVKDRVGIWYANYYLLMLEVAENQIISNTETFTVSIDRENNFRIPDKLTKNDGILRIEGRGAMIRREPIKKSPLLGDPKFVYDSRIIFEPVSTNTRSIARITFRLLLNTDVLPNSSISITMGGILRHPPTCDSAGITYCADRSATVTLSGKNAPLFVGGVGQWSQETVTLSLTMISSVQIFSGELIRFFLERDQYFMLPYATYQNDPSFQLEIREAGVAKQPFNFSTRINQDTKTFTISEIFYGVRGSVAYPNTAVGMTVRFMPNVDLPEGSIVRFTLPGYTSPFVNVPLDSVEVPIRDELYISETIPFGVWTQQQYSLDIIVPARYTLPRQITSVFRVLEQNAFRLPADSLLPNDPKLTIAVIKNQIIYPEPIKSSPRVVDRTFDISEFDYRPANARSSFLLWMRLVPTVPIGETNTLTINLLGFRNTLSKRNIQITGQGRQYIRDSMGEWNETTQVLTLNIATGVTAPAFGEIILQVEESQGFILPASLNANDTTIRIASRNNIEPSQPIKKSPMVGNGPFTAHRFCMFQYDHGVRTGTPICNAAADCNPPLLDPCSAQELERCGCDPGLDQIFPIRVTGFNLQDSDELTFLTLDKLCGIDSAGPSILSNFTPPTAKTVTPTRDVVEYHGIQAIDTGYFRVCVNHDGTIYDVGIMVVRPSCQNSLVLLGGSCVEHCPKTKIPVAGQCRRDEISLRHEDDQDLMIPVRWHSTASSSLVGMPWSDPEVQYFRYRYTYELARLLSCDAKRIQVESLTSSQLTVNTVFKKVGPVEVQSVSTERTPLSLITLLRALQYDQSSTLYRSEFFKDIDRTFMPDPLPVRLCSDNAYRVFCPYTGTIMATGSTIAMFLGFVLLMFLVVTTASLAVWFIDRDKPTDIDQELLDKIRRDPNLVEPPVQVEYARSWLEGRFMGEEWEKARKVKFLSLAN